MSRLQDILNSLKELRKQTESINLIESKPYPNEYS